MADSSIPRTRIGIRCDRTTSAFSSDLRVAVHLHRTLAELAKLAEPPEVVLLTAPSAAAPRIDSQVAATLGLRSVPSALDCKTATLLGVCRTWLRWSNRLNAWQNQLSDVATDAWHGVGDWLRRQSGVTLLLLIPALLVAWPIFALVRVVMALLWGIGFPLWMADRLNRRLEFALGRRELGPIHAADCAVWIVPYPHNWPALDLPAVLLLGEAAQLRAGLLPQPGRGVPDGEAQCCHATFVVTTDDAPVKHGKLCRLDLPAERVVAAPEPAAWPKLLRHALDLAPARRGLDPEPLTPWPMELETWLAPAQPLEAFLFLQIPWGGGNWEHTRDLVHALTEISAQDRRLRLSLGIHQTQAGAWSLPDGIPVQRCRFNALSRTDAAGFSPEAPHWLMGRAESSFCFLSGGTEAALRADAWLALSDRFPLPLLPARPYGVVVHDMIHRHVPEALGSAFFTNLEAGMRPTIRHAARIIVTSPCTRADVLAGYELAEEHVDLIPVACEPHRRFAELPTGWVPLPRRDFILNVTNASPHKGADLMLRGQAQLKQRLGAATPLLVVCGINTELLSPALGQGGHPFWVQCRKLQQDLGLRLNQDVVFLGPITDIELKDLYTRCRAVVNAARHDNGTYCLIEGAWFGKPVLSTRYPAAEFLADRFGLPVRFFPLHDAQELAAELAAALAEPPPRAHELLRRRARLAVPEFSLDHYATRLYAILLELARQGRAARLQRLPNEATWSQAG
jgi:glycosyltransferase involved in cell wall biosynthesis